MTALATTTTTALQSVDDGLRFDETHLAALASLARYNGRPLDAYRHDVRMFFQWCNDAHVEVLKAKRPHIELYRGSMEDHGLAASTIDRRLSTVCGFYRFAHIDGRMPSNPAQYVRRPKVPPSQGHGMDRAELAPSCSPLNASTTTTPPLPSCSDSTACVCRKPAPPTSRTLAC